MRFRHVLAADFNARGGSLIGWCRASKMSRECLEDEAGPVF